MQSPRFTPPPLLACHPVLTVVLTALVTSASPIAARAQVVGTPTDTAAVEIDPNNVVSSARSAQASFERRRLRHLPLAAFGSGQGRCDEHVGRFCTWYEEGEWFPVPEDQRIIDLRRDMVSTLDSLQTLAPASDWILGQRVWYRAEAGDWDGAIAVARRCGRVEHWWCRALEGFALHGTGRYAAALDRFDDALASMDDDRAREWRIPEWPIESRAREAIGDADEREQGEILELLWRLADPLYLVDGNDRLTAHYARWTVATLRDRARNPFHIRWGSDLDQLTIRHGWEMGWERAPTRDFTSLDHVIGHKHPQGRDFMPPGSALTSPESATTEDLRADRRRPRSLYAPDYAPVLLPMGAQIALFPRGQTTVVVGTPSLPPDTTFHAGHNHPLPWMEPGIQEGLPDRTGLFALPLNGGSPRRVERSGRSEGALMLEVPTGEYVLSLESWSPGMKRAGRDRLGVPARAAPEDVATLSDLLLLRPASSAPETLAAAVDLALPRARIRPGQTFGVGWEIAGLGFRPETLIFEVSVHRKDRGVFRRVGEFLRLTGRRQPIALSWEEPGPTEPGHVFRYLDLELPALEPGTYEIRLVLRTADRSDAVSTLTFEVSEERAG